MKQASVLKIMARFWISLAVIASLLALVALQASEAAAHVVYEQGNSGRSDDDCMWQKSEVSHGSQSPNNGAYFLAITGAKRDHVDPWTGQFFSCYYQVNVGAGGLTTQIQSYTTQPDGSATLLCLSSGPLTNTSTAWAWSVYYDRASVPCGVNYYRSRAFGRYPVNGVTLQNYMWSGTPGTHLLPSAP